MAAVPSSSMIDTSIFEQLQLKIDEDVQIRENIRNAVQVLEKQERTTISILSAAHSTPAAELGELTNANPSVAKLLDSIAALKAASKGHPYYKYNSMWTREMQTACFCVIFHFWLGHKGKLLTIEDVGSMFDIPVNLKDEDSFHLSIEEYLHALITLMEELARLAVNSVTLGDNQRPLQISKFVKDLHAGFQILNLKNDSLRKRSDSIKYQVRTHIEEVKKIEDVVYDLSLRGLIPRGPAPS